MLSLAFGTNLTLSVSVRVRTVSVKLLFCAVNVPMFTMMKFFSVNQGRAHSGLVGDQKGRGTGGLHRKAAATQWRTGRRGDFISRGGE
ncbi:MAG: hypothetical protein Q8S75_05850 [Nitrospirota bacterium]|nr:hypothetical protein [Nitrospirota bacterium]